MYVYQIILLRSQTEPNKAQNQKKKNTKTSAKLLKMWTLEEKKHTLIHISLERSIKWFEHFVSQFNEIKSKDKKSNSRKNERVINSIWKKRKELAINFSSFLINLPLGGKQKTKELKNNDETVFLSLSLSISS